MKTSRSPRGSCLLFGRLLEATVLPKDEDWCLLVRPISREASGDVGMDGEDPTLLLSQRDLIPGFMRRGALPPPRSSSPPKGASKGHGLSQSPHLRPGPRFRQ